MSKHDEFETLSEEQTRSRGFEPPWRTPVAIVAMVIIVIAALLAAIAVLVNGW